MWIWEDRVLEVTVGSTVQVIQAHGETSLCFLLPSSVILDSLNFPEKSLNTCNDEEW